ncbi:substrate-binding periplasmic protein [Pseudoduganella sp. UC29_106]|uniref:substrate-binding periplasmic protein n=1 Tax=Pseudoduganella sp. UC29_106 TaxID=3374553 RepID=UPI003757E327
MKASLALAALALAAATNIACAAPALEAWSINIEPWGFEHTGEGIAPAFLSFIADSADVPLEVSVRPYLRAVEGLRSGQNALSMLIPTPDRDAIAFVLCQPATVRLSILYRRDIVGAASLPSDLVGRTIGMLRGSQVLATYAATVPFHASLVNTQEQGMRMMRAGRLDGTVCSYPGCRAAMRSVGLDMADFGEVSLGSHPLAVLVSRTSPLAEDKAALARLRAACESKEGQRLMAALLARWD